MMSEKQRRSGTSEYYRSFPSAVICEFPYDKNTPGSTLPEVCGFDSDDCWLRYAAGSASVFVKGPSTAPGGGGTKLASGGTVGVAEGSVVDDGAGVADGLGGFFTWFTSLS